jgi:hypothetical protein
MSLHLYAPCFRAPCVYVRGAPRHPWSLFPAICPPWRSPPPKNGGAHALSCTAARWSLHNALRDAIFWLAAEANLAPRLEIAAFPGTTLRPGIVLARATARGPRRVFVVDVAVVHPLATAHLRAAQRSAAGAATAYEAVKREHYAPAMADAPEEVELVPLVFETYGGASEGTVELLRPLARAWGWRRDIGPARAAPLAFARVSAAVMGAVGRILSASEDPTGAKRSAGSEGARRR